MRSTISPAVRINRSIFLLLSICLIWLSAETKAEDGWGLYENPRFGFVIPVPPGMSATPPPTNGDGRGFVSGDGQIHLSAWGSFNVDGFSDVKKRWKEELAVEGRTVTYKRKTSEWFVVSGIEADGTHFYYRHTANAKYAAGWMIRYPANEEARLSAWVERIAAGYEARLGEGSDTIE